MQRRQDRKICADQHALCAEIVYPHLKQKRIVAHRIEMDIRQGGGLPGIASECGERGTRRDRLGQPVIHTGDQPMVEAAGGSNIMNNLEKIRAEIAESRWCKAIPRSR